jgi:hypothetical protein
VGTFTFPTKKALTSKKTLELVITGLKNTSCVFNPHARTLQKQGFASHGVFPSVGTFTFPTKKALTSKKTLDQVYGLC